MLEAQFFTDTGQHRDPRYLLLNSDGLTDYVKDNEIKRLLVKEGTIEDHGDQLMQLALDNHSKDNVTFILAAIEGDKV